MGWCSVGRSTGITSYYFHFLRSIYSTQKPVLKTPSVTFIPFGREIKFRAPYKAPGKIRVEMHFFNGLIQFSLEAEAEIYVRLMVC